MATASLPLEPSEKECSICHELFTEPKILLCRHLLCRHCLLSWLQSQDEAHCPLCRCPIIEDESGRSSQSLQKIADGLPTDFGMKTLVEAEQFLVEQHVCCLCVNEAAMSLCFDCADMLCTSCVIGHRKTAATSDHSVEKLTSLTSETLAAKRRRACSVHNDKTSAVFCPTHGESICLLCAQTSHRQCPGVTDLRQKADEARAELAELAAMLSAGEARLERAIKRLDQELHETEQKAKAAIAEIEATLDRLESAVKACRRRLKELTLSSSADVKKVLQDGKTCLLQRRGKLTSHKRVINRAKDMTIHDDVRDMIFAMNTRTNDLDCSVTLPTKTFSRLNLTIGSQSVSRIEKDLSRLGRITVDPVAEPAEFTAAPAKFRFHSNHGKNIVLSISQQTADKGGSDDFDGIVMFPEPMAINKLYEVRVDQTDGRSGYDLPVGVVTSSPDAIARLPRDPWGWNSAVVVFDNLVFDHGRKTYTSVGAALRDLAQGSRVGVSIDIAGCLHLHLNGQDQGVVSPFPLPYPCYAMFSVQFSYRTITALPVVDLM